jgi:uncharacterized protein
MSGFHEGELAVQRRAGVSGQAARLAGMLDPPAIDGGLRAFLADRDLVMITARDRAGRLWTSPLFGPPGFLRGHDATLEVGALPGADDPLAGMPVGQPVGMIAVDFARRRRVRLNGTLSTLGERGLVVDADQAYGNCPSYIQQRVLEHGPGPAADPRDAGGETGTALTGEEIALVRRADTFILGTTHPERGSDASHRGGAPGFVRVEDGELWWPDYPGNNLFNSMGNIAVDPETALLFFDFDAGTLLQLSGRARLEWSDPGGPGDDGGTGRRVRFTPDHVVLRRGVPLHALAFRPFPRNPPVAS